MSATTAISDTTTWNRVWTPVLTEVSAEVAIAVSAPGTVYAATYRAIARKMIMTTISRPFWNVDEPERRL